MYCPRCRKQIDNGKKFCDDCGSRLLDNSNIESNIIIETSTNSSCTSVYSNFKFNYPNYYYQAEGEAQKTEHPPENNNYPCKSNNWMNKKLWSMTAYPAYANNVWTITDVGSATCVTSNDNYGIYPAFYLKADIILSGSGTSSDPYKIQ